MINSQWTAFGAQGDERVSTLLAASPLEASPLFSDHPSVTLEEMASLLFSAGFGGAEVDEDEDFVIPELMEPLS